jgi:hypothetical protein
MMSPPAPAQEASPPLMRLDQETTSSPHVASKRKASTGDTSGTGSAATTPKTAANSKKGFRFQRQPMDPEMERELALKQLNELPTLKRSRRKTKDVIAPQSKTQEASIQTSALQQHHLLTNGNSLKIESRPEGLCLVLIFALRRCSFARRFECF